MKRNILILAAVICLGLVACGPSRATTVPSPTETIEPTTTPEVFMPLPDDQRAFEAVRQTLAKQLNVDPLSITLVDVQPMQWPDSCLNLPAANEMCAQMVTPGFLIHVKAGDTVYEFHTDLTAQNIREKK